MSDSSSKYLGIRCVSLQCADHAAALRVRAALAEARVEEAKALLELFARGHSRVAAAKALLAKWEGK